MKRKYGLYIMMAVLTLSATMLAGCKQDAEEMPADDAILEVFDVSDNELAGLEESEDGVYYVSSMEELLNAIGPDAEIVVEPGYYNISEYVDEVWEAEGEKWNESHPYVQLQECEDGVEVVIRDVSGLYITGDSVNTADVEFVTESEYGAVFTFMNCSDMMLEMMTFGHVTSGLGEGNVLNFSDCAYVELFGLDINCSEGYGISARSGCEEFFVTECVVRDCFLGPFSIKEFNGAFDFVNCELIDSDSDGLYEPAQDSILTFYGCTFGEIESANLFFREDIYTEECIWSDEVQAYIEAESAMEEDEMLGDYPLEDWEEEDEASEEFDVSNWQQVPLDNEVLEYSYWMGYALIDPQSGTTEYLPYEKPDGSTIDVAVELDEAGLGWIEYNGESYEIRWVIDSEYSVSFQSDTLNANGTVYGEPYEDEVIMWMKLTLDGYTFWLY